MYNQNGKYKSTNSKTLPVEFLPLWSCMFLCLRPEMQISSNKSKTTSKDPTPIADITIVCLVATRFKESWSPYGSSHL